jgi:hypothetical protein
MAEEPTVVATVPSVIGQPFLHPSEAPWVKTSIELKKGQRYLIIAIPSTNPRYKDATIPCTPEGPKGVFGFLFDRLVRQPNRLSPFHYLGHGRTRQLRVLTDRVGKRASFLTLIAAIGQDDSRQNVVVIGSRHEFEAHRDGTLYLFSNDWPGGPGTEGDERFIQTHRKTGHRHAPTYGNNQGHLHITVTLLQPR